MATTTIRLFHHPPLFKPRHFRRKFTIRNGPLPSPLPSETNCPVPLSQQPINEYKSLSSSFPFSLALEDEFETRMFVSGVVFGGLVGFPVAWVGSKETEMAVLGAICGGLGFVTVAVVRIYLGWAYVGNRLLSATVEYEETGWYDGQIWVKTAEVLARDRLLGSFSVKPMLSRLKNTLVALAVSLFVCAIMFINLEDSRKDLYKFSNEAGGRAVPGVYNDESARSFEPEAFCGEPDLE